MRVLMVHNRYLQRGGEDVSTDTDVALLEDAGHEVDRLEASNTSVAELGRLRTAARSIWSQASYRQMRELVAGGEYDVVHVQNFFPLLSPSIHHAAAATGVPVIQSLRNYRLMCPAATFFRDGRPCEDCLGRRVPLPAVRHACYRESTLGSAVVTAMAGIHNAVGTWDRTVAAFIAPSDFTRQKFVEGGIAPPERIVVKPNAVHPDPGIGRGLGGYVLLAGRLTKEKGIETVLRAWESKEITSELLVVGDGPLRPLVEEVASRDARITWRPETSTEEVYRLMGEARLVVVPSEWYETFGRVVVEAYATGTPVVAARIGALQELVEEDSTGWLFTPGDGAEVASIVIGAERSDLTPQRTAARAAFVSRYSGEVTVTRLVSIYEDARASV